MQEEILTFQFGAFSNSILNDYWDLEQINAQAAVQEKAEAIQNSIFVRGDPKRPRTIIFDLKDNLENYNFYQTKANTTNVQENKPYWDQNKIQIVDNTNEEEKEEHTKKKTSYFSKFGLSERNFCKVPPSDNYFNNFLHGNRLLQNVEQVDMIEDKIRYYLEESDYLRGFQCFLDVNSGFGSLNKHILQYLNEECPKNPVIMYAFDNEHYPNTKQDEKNEKNERILKGLKFLNKTVNMYEMKEYATCYIPIDVENILNFKHLNPDVLNIAPKKSFNLLSFIISNLSVPYRLTSTESHSDSIKDFIEQLLPYPELYIFNAAFHIPGFPQIQDKEDVSKILKYQPTIFDYKEYQPLCLFSQSSKDLKKSKLSNYATFAEDFVLRGGLSGVKIPKKMQTSGFNFHVQEQEILLQDNLYNLFDQKVLSKMGFISQGENHPEFYKVPFHSVLFSNEMTKFYLEDTVKAYRAIDKGAKLQFLKEDYTEDDFKEMENHFYNMRDSYENSKQDEGSEDDDDF